MNDATNIQMELLMGYTGGETIVIDAKSAKFRGWIHDNEFPESMDRKQLIQFSWDLLVHDN